MSIKPLSKETVKLINSTQVISSIYSAVKELVENSLDAEAQNIEVNLVDNGLSLIEIKDNGIGICREDAPYMALPAYTSKISNFNDLDLLSTYGFRGEGLTAVCQVSDVTICTKTAADEAMICYTLDNEGNVVDSKLSHGLTGTSVQMRNLFKNMPVRRNILNNKKRIAQEIKTVEILLKSYAFCKSTVRFLFRVNGNVIFTKPSCKNIVEGIKSVLGMQIYSKLKYIEKSFNQTEMQLFVPKKEIHDASEISQVGLQFLCVNDRPIRSKEIEKRINKRISEYFNANSSNSRKFIFCLTLQVDPSLLDVNLEPNKDKVFLQNEDVILNEIDKSLLDYYEIPDSQVSVQNDTENINYNGQINQPKEKDLEKEWPACKKRKIDSQNENICNTIDSVRNKKKLNSQQSIGENVKKTDKEFLEDIQQPILSDSDSNDANEFLKNQKIKEMEVSEHLNNDSEIFDFGQDISKNQVEEETLSQLPKVDLGEDFDWQEIVHNKKPPIINSDDTSITTNQQETTDVIWSKGQVSGLNNGVTVDNKNKINIQSNLFKEQEIMSESQNSEPFDLCQDVKKINDSEESVVNNDVPMIEAETFDWELNTKSLRRKNETRKSNDVHNKSGPTKQTKKSSNSHADPTQTRIAFAGDNACLTTTRTSAFAMYCTNARPKILKQHPEWTPAEVAIYMNKSWKELTSEEREYYRDLANESNESLCNISMSQSYRKPKSQLSQADKDKNKKQLINMLGNMKTNKAEVKNESVIMRTFVPWNISMQSLTKKFREPVIKAERSIVGSLNTLLWVISLTTNLYLIDITELHAQLNITNFDMSQINPEHVEKIVEQWIREKNDMSIFHPLHVTKMT